MRLADPQTAAQVVHPQRTAEQPCDTPVDEAVARQDRNEEREDVHEMRRVAQRDLTLGQRLAYEAVLLLLQVANAAVHELRRARRRAAGKVTSLDEGGPQAAARGVERAAGPGDPPAHHHDVEFLGTQAVERTHTIERHPARLPPSNLRPQC